MERNGQTAKRKEDKKGLLQKYSFDYTSDGKMKKVADVFSDWHVDEDVKGQILIVQELNSKNQNIIGILGKEFGYFDWIIK